MGQKVNPIGFRVGVNRTWSSRWYSRHGYASMLQEDIRIRRFINKKFADAGVAEVEIERAARNLKINVYSKRPGIIIGKKGAGAEALRDEITRKCQLVSGTPIINVLKINKPDINAQLVAQNIKSQLERRISFRRAMKKAMSLSIKNGAKGIKIACAGRLGGADMSRTEQYKEGRIPLHTLRADVDYATQEAATTYGIIGIKVWIYRGDKIAVSKKPSQLGA